MHILLIDNYDSFTFNLAHYLVKAGATIEVCRNDAIPSEIAGVFDAVVLSPGPGIPQEAGDMMPFIRRFAPKIPMLGVCLGHQALAEHFGGNITNLSNVCHGRSTACNVIMDDPIFSGLGKQFEAGHYHSWVVAPDQPGDGMEVIAVNASGWVMAIRHKHLPLRGVQFHPESVMTPGGQQLIDNWVAYASALTSKASDRLNAPFKSAAL